MFQNSQGLWITLSGSLCVSCCSGPTKSRRELNRFGIPTHPGYQLILSPPATTTHTHCHTPNTPRLSINTLTTSHHCSHTHKHTVTHPTHPGYQLILSPPATTTHTQSHSIKHEEQLWFFWFSYRKKIADVFIYRHLRFFFKACMLIYGKE